ncbi:putative reductase [Pseudoruegeria aquimaris]|uniref:Putative reductase n=1 Tax=Pseudoruegeria aquimaris TaxID=393663 RepID=A0A1Y5SQE5_9RHOB|nr:ArsC/Spx/MgsR family protein [Pseudoruegeria aquimaris]SLN44270.1 putative reductase [Pseudoruegeria aquimaris]
MKLYGLKTCDTCRKALKDLKDAGVEVAFVDVRADGVPERDLARFLTAFGENLINRRSTTWRGLDEAARAAAPLALLQAHPTLMKRPVIEAGDRLFLGWTAQTRAALLADG